MMKLLLQLLTCLPRFIFPMLFFVWATPALVAQNLLVNGDFESGGAGTGFQTNYFLPASPGNSSPRNYDIISNPFTMNNAFFSNAADHTFGNGSGKMMVVDGSGNSGDKVWELINGSSIGVISGRKYIFSYWIRSISSSNDATNSAIIKVYTNGTSTAPVLIAGSQTCPTGSPSAWVQVSYSWTATTSNAQIWLTDEQTNGGGAGNDFALDDITLVEDNGPLSLRYCSNGSACPSDNNAVIAAWGRGGVLPYSFSLNNGPFQPVSVFPLTAPSTGNQLRIIDSKTPVPDTVVATSIDIPLAINKLSVSNDTTICSSVPVNLLASGGANYTWTANTAPGIANLSAANIANPVATPTATTIYTVTADVVSDNLITNPGFENGDSGFYTDYVFYTNTTNQQAYGITNNAQLFDASFSPCTSHNNPGTGKMMVVDGATSNRQVWSQVIAVSPNTNYTFSFYMQTLALPIPSQLLVTINAQVLGTAVAPALPCGWVQYSYNWNSGASTLAYINLANVTTAVNGNDFALDDLSFTTTCTVSKSVTITVGSLSAPQISITQPTCTTPTGSVIVTSPLSGVIYSFNNGVSYQVSPLSGALAPGNTYQVKVKDNSGCESSATPAIINSVPAAPALPAITVVQPDCNNATGSIAIVSPLGANFIYSVDGINYQPGTLFNNLPAAGYSVTVKDINTGCISLASTTVLTSVTPPPVPVIGTVTQPGCAVPTGIVIISSPAGGNYFFSKDGVNYNLGNTIAGLAPGSYSITVKDILTGCISAPVSVVINPAPGVPATPVINIVQPGCGAATGSFTIISPLGANYLYSKDGFNYQVSPQFNTVAPGTYSVTVKDVNNGCISIAITAVINAAPAVPAAPVMGNIVQPGCTVATGSFSILSPTGANYVYSKDGINFQSAVQFNPVLPGAYIVTVKDINSGCVSSAASVTINAAPVVPAAPVIGNIIQPDCNNSTGSFVVIAPLGNTISYSKDGISYQSAALFNNLTPASYTVTARDNNTLCISAGTVVIINASASAPAAPIVNITQPTCTNAGAVITVTPVAAVLYSFDNGASYQASNTYSAQAGITYQMVLKNNAGCISPSTPAVVNAQPATPPAPVITVIQPTCSVSTGSVSVTAPLTGMLFSFDNGVAFQPSPVSLPLAAGNTYAVKVKNTDGCISAATNAVINAQPQIPAAPLVTDTVSYCQGAAAATLSAVGQQLKWYSVPVGGLVSLTAPIPVTSIPGNTLYYVSQTVNGCESQRSVIVVKVTPAPAAPVVISPVEYCRGNTALPLNPAGNGLNWYTVATGGLPQSSIIPSTQQAGAFNYYVSETNGGCEGPRAMVTVVVKNGPSLGLDRSVYLCYGGSLNLVQLFDTTGFPINYQLNGTMVVKPDSVYNSGTYIISAAAANGCTDTAFVVLTVLPPVSVFAGNDTTVVLGQPFQLAATGGGDGAFYHWTDLGPSFTAQFSDSFIANPTVRLYDFHDSLQVQVTNNYGCSASDVIRFIVLPGPAFYVPNAFSPNADGLNDIIKPIPVGIAAIRYFRIYNRYGQLVFETSRYQEGWDGNFKGKPQHAGNYVWTLQGVDRNGRLINMKGNLVLVR